ncbi:MAG: tripartite tricarboxylate transporter substrate binding protein [Geminicoccaceae bacterium]
MADQMSRARRAVLGYGVAILAAATFGGFAGPALADYPEKPIRVIVPTQAGGGMDSVARIFQRYFDENDVLGQKMVVVNMDGAGGTVGTRAIRDAEPDGYTIGMWHEGLITSNVMGVADFDHTAFELIGVTGYGDLGFGVGKDSPYQTFDALLDAARAAPNTIKCATNIGLPVHFVPLMVQDEAGVEFRYVQVGGGAKRFPSVVARHTDFAIFGAIELVKWSDADLVPIVLFADQRNPLLPDVPTAKELGVDVVARNNRIWLGPKGMPDEVVAHLNNAFRTAMADPKIQEQMVDQGLVPVFVEPDALLTELDWWAAKAGPLVAKARELQQ